MKILLSLLAFELATFTLAVLSIIQADTYIQIAVLGLLLWISEFAIKPVLKVLLLPFNVVTLGALGAVVYTLLTWFCFWVVPGLSLQSIIIGGITISGIPLLILFSLTIALLHNLYLKLLKKLLK